MLRISVKNNELKAQNAFSKDMDSRELEFKKSSIVESTPKFKNEYNDYDDNHMIIIITDII